MPGIPEPGLFLWRPAPLRSLLPGLAGPCLAWGGGKVSTEGPGDPDGEVGSLLSEALLPMGPWLFLFVSILFFARRDKVWVSREQGL